MRALDRRSAPTPTRAPVAARAREADPLARAQSGSSGGLLELQRSAGNRAVTKLVHSWVAEASAASDASEREAERFADAFTGGGGQGGPVRAVAGGGPSRPAVSLSPAAHANPAGGPIAAGLARRIDRARSGGAPFGSALRGPLQAALGADLASVRVHTDAPADSMSRELGADAFTTGSDVFFRSGRFRPGSPGGDHLIAHEMAHVAQHGSQPGPVVHRSLVRDRVYSDAEFTQGTPPRTGGGEEREWQALVAGLKQLEAKHRRLDLALAALRKQDPFSQSFNIRQKNMGKAVETSEGVIAELGAAIVLADNFVTYEEGKRAGLGGKVKNLFRGRQAKKDKASRIDKVRTLLFQLRRREDQVRVDNQARQLELTSIEHRQGVHEQEAPEQKKQAIEEAKAGRFGPGTGTVKDAKFGSGAMGSVARVDYELEGGKTFQGVFKAEPDRMPDVDGGMSAMGTSEEAPNFSLRAVAASRLNDLMGMKVIPHTELAFHDQFGFGQVMALASGRSPSTKVKTELENVDEEKVARIEKVLRQEAKETGEMTKLIRKETQTGEVKHFLEETVTFQTDWDSPIVKRELSNLQLMDALIGNVDRHAENYFIQVDALGNPIGVLGIDNDLTFARDKNDPTEVAFRQGHHAGMPPAIDSQVARRFCSVTEERVRTAVEGLLTALETETLIVRLRSIQEKLEEKAANGQYVIQRINSDLKGAQQWVDLADPSNTKGAYFARERNWQLGTMAEQGRLLKRGEALVFLENRVDEVLRKAHQLEDQGGAEAKDQGSQVAPGQDEGQQEEKEEDLVV